MGLAIFPPGNLIEREQPSVGRGCPESTFGIGEDSVALGNGRKPGNILARKNDGAHPVKTHESILRRQPHVAIARLRDGSHGGRQQAIGGLPYAQQKILFRTLDRTLVDGGVLAAHRRNDKSTP